MRKQVLVAPSTDPCPMAELSDYVRELEDAGADWLHCDIMDGKFVPNKTYDEIIFSLVAKRVQMPKDVHLMIEDPLSKVLAYAKAGADHITVHCESFGDKLSLINVLNKIKDAGCKAGISLKPDTEVERVLPYLPFLDIVLIMSVEPGKSGQVFLPAAYSKIATLNKLRDERGYEFLIEVDGGINLSNAAKVASMGADVLVSGNAVYSAENREEIITRLKGL